MTESFSPTHSSKLHCLTALGAALCALIPCLFIARGKPSVVLAGGGGDDWYASPSGNNTSCSSWATACNTIQGAYNKAASGDRILIAAGTYSEHLVLQKNLIITGTHPDYGSITKIEASTTGPAIEIYSGYTISLTGVTIHNSKTSINGGGIYNKGTLEMNDISLTDVTATTYGGGIYNDGTAILHNVTIIDNIVTQSGGGIYNNAGRSLTINNSTIGKNTASFGGGIYNLGSIILSGLVITGNAATTGGGIYNDSSLAATLNDVMLYGNSSTMGGGGIFNNSELNFTDVTIEHNHTDTVGGGLNNYSIDTDATLWRVTFNDNTADTRGGGICHTNGTAFLGNVTLSNNEAGNILNAGGGIYNSSGTMTIINATIVYNDVAGGSGTGGVVNIDGTINMDNSIIAFNDNANCSGTISSDYHRNLNNVAEDYSCDSDEDLLGYDPLLGPLQNNGGKTKTHALGRGSQAIDNGDNSSYVCSPTDQRGFMRPLDGNGDGSAYCDIGAYEYAYPVYLPLLLR